MRAFRAWTLLVSLAMHGALLLLLLQWQDEGAEGVGVGGVRVALSPAGSAPGSVAAVEAVTTDTLGPAETAESSEAIEVPTDERPTALQPVAPPDVEPTPPDLAEPVSEPAPGEVASSPPPDAPPVGAQRLPPPSVEKAKPGPAPQEAERPEVERARTSEMEAVSAREAAHAIQPPPEAASLPDPLVTEPQPAERSPQAPAGADATAVPPEASSVWPLETVETAAAPEAAGRPSPTEAQRAEPESALVRETGPVPPPRKSEPPREPARTAKRSQPSEPRSAAETAARPGAAGRAGEGEQADVGAGAGGAGGGVPGPSADYLDVLKAWLERHKEYPRRAQMRRQEGTILLRFVIDREGHVLSYRIERSSGHASLDEAVEAMLERAQPLPPMPPEMTQARLELAVPVTFQLR